MTSPNFVSTHALALGLIGVGLGWLALNAATPRRHVPTLRGDFRRPRASAL